MITGPLSVSYCKWYLHAMSFLRKKYLIFCEKLQSHMSLEGGGEACWSITDVLNLGNLEEKIHNCAHLLNFPALFSLYHMHALIF